MVLHEVIMKKLFVLLALVSLPSFSKTYVGTFWKKALDCPSVSPICFPQQMEKPTQFDFAYPDDFGVEETQIYGKTHVVDILMARKKDQVDYMIFQVTVKTLRGDVISVCSRYESIETLESIPVGSCGGRGIDNPHELVGFTISLDSQR